jgi:uncharacterized membrane protein YedE/YeeE
MLATVGLLVIGLSWVFQFLAITKKNKSLNSVFVGGYVIGVGWLIVDGITSKSYTLAGLNTVAMVAALGTWWRISNK